MTTTTVQADSFSIRGSTRNSHEFRSGTPDLMTVFKDAVNEQRDDAIEETIAWSLKLRPDIGAEQLRREAW